MFRPHPRPVGSEFQGGRPCHQYFYSILQFICTCNQYWRMPMLVSSHLIEIFFLQKVFPSLHPTPPQLPHPQTRCSPFAVSFHCRYPKKLLALGHSVPPSFTGQTSEPAPYTQDVPVLISWLMEWDQTDVLKFHSYSLMPALCQTLCWALEI